MALMFPELQPHERAERYRTLADEARRVVLRSTGTTRESWISFERQWEQLAAEADADGDKLH